MPMRLPRWIAVLAVVGATFVLLPLVALLLRLQWRQLPSLLTSDSATAALGLSLRTSACATLACLVLGVPLALFLARSTWGGGRVLRAALLLPLVLPPVVGGIALLSAFGRRGLLGSSLQVLGWDIGFTTAAVVIAQTFVAMPFLVIALEGALRTVGDRYAQVASTLGAAPTTVLRRITLPVVLPALLSGAVLAFARALGEFGATITFAGSLQGTTRTLPLEIYLQRETDPQAAVALSLLLVVVAALVIAAVPRTRVAP